jgi:transcription elongation GreA/GreB family factor
VAGAEPRKGRRFGQPAWYFWGVSLAAKSLLRERLLESLERERDTLSLAQRSAQEGATHEENRSEGDKDMRATEASYLARGQAERVVALEAEIQRLRAVELRAFSAGDPIVAGALVTLSTAGRRSVVFLVPAGAGTEISDGERQVRVVTPASPLGRALLGAHVGDVVEVERGASVQEWEVLGSE